MNRTIVNKDLVLFIFILFYELIYFNLLPAVWPIEV